MYPPGEDKAGVTEGSSPGGGVWASTGEIKKISDKIQRPANSIFFHGSICFGQSLFLRQYSVPRISLSAIASRLLESLPFSLREAVSLSFMFSDSWNGDRYRAFIILVFLEISGRQLLSRERILLRILFWNSDTNCLLIRLYAPSWRSSEILTIISWLTDLILNFNDNYWACQLR